MRPLLRILCALVFLCVLCVKGSASAKRKSFSTEDIEKNGRTPETAAMADCYGCCADCYGPPLCPSESERSEAGG